MLYSILCFYFSVWIVESLRQGLHMVASWDYHRGAKIRGSVRGNPGRFTDARHRDRPAHIPCIDPWKQWERGIVVALLAA
jgi:hypothetical protein